MIQRPNLTTPKIESTSPLHSSESLSPSSLETSFSICEPLAKTSFSFRPGIFRKISAGDTLREVTHKSAARMLGPARKERNARRLAESQKAKKEVSLFKEANFFREGSGTVLDWLITALARLLKRFLHPAKATSIPPATKIIVPNDLKVRPRKRWRKKFF